MQEKQILLQQLNERAQYLQKKLQVLEHQLKEISDVKVGLENIGDDMLFPLGAGVFVKGKRSSEKLMVNIGKGVVVEKDVSDVLKTVSDQLSRLEEISVQMNQEMGEVVGQMQMVQLELQKA
jgi:prefoldin alpha subunit